MSRITPDFLLRVQMAGWLIAAADEESVWGECPRNGCDLTLKFRPGQNVPQACKDKSGPKGVRVEVFDDAREPLRDRRMDLHLSIKDIEEAAGMTVDFLAKFEKDNPSKYPNVQTFVEWAQSAGYEVWLIRGKLPRVTLRTIAETRGLVSQRKNAFRTAVKARLEKRGA